MALAEWFMLVQNRLSVSFKFIALFVVLFGNEIKKYETTALSLSPPLHSSPKECEPLPCYPSALTGRTENLMTESWEQSKKKLLVIDLNLGIFSFGCYQSEYQSHEKSRQNKDCNREDIFAELILPKNGLRVRCVPSDKRTKCVSFSVNCLTSNRIRRSVKHSISY